jgi:hypothetical protein
MPCPVLSTAAYSTCCFFTSSLTLTWCEPMMFWALAIVHINAKAIVIDICFMFYISLMSN